MGTIIRIVGGILGMALGTVIVIKSEWFLENFGAIPWAEDKLGTSGGTRFFYKLIGIAIALIGIMAATNMLGGFLLGTVGRLFLPPPQ